MKLIITRAAVIEIAEIEAWWMANRTKASTLFIEELEAALTRLAMHPYSGLRYEPVRGGHRVLLVRSSYHVYVTIADDAVEVFAVIGAATSFRPRR